MKRLTQKLLYVISGLVGVIVITLGILYIGNNYKMYNDKESSEQSSIEKVARRIPSNIPTEIKVEIEGLFSADAEKRAIAATRLGRKFGRKRAVPAIPFLIELLSDDTTVKWKSDFYNIIPIEYKWRTAHFFNVTSVGEVAAESLMNLCDFATEALIAIMKDNNPTTRANAALALAGTRKNRRVLKHLINALKDDEWGVRKAAAESLCILAEGKVVITKSGKRTFNPMISSDSVTPLMSLLKDENCIIRRISAETLGHIGDFRAVESLIHSLNENTEKGDFCKFREKTIGALKMITGNNFEDPIEWQQWCIKNNLCKDRNKK